MELMTLHYVVLTACQPRDYSPLIDRVAPVHITMNKRDAARDSYISIYSIDHPQHDLATFKLKLTKLQYESLHGFVEFHANRNERMLINIVRGEDRRGCTLTGRVVPESRIAAAIKQENATKVVGDFPIE